MANQAYIVTDLSFGDAGKGTTVDYLVRQAKSAVVVKYTGGAQCAHNVVTPEGKHHTFAQFGSGSFVSGVKTHIAGDFLVNPSNMLVEAEYLQNAGVKDAWQRVSVDRNVVVITPWQVQANRIREVCRGENRHGSCGQGIGETRHDSLVSPHLVLRVRDIANPEKLERSLREIRAAKFEQLKNELGDISKAETKVFFDDRFLLETAATYREWGEKIKVVDSDFLKLLAYQHQTLVFEGSQGVLLDEWRGFHPYTTWSTTTHQKALELLGVVDFGGETVRLGLIRAYTTRHGAGPFVTESPEMTATLPDNHNGTEMWQGAFRVGYLDMVAHRYALSVCEKTDGFVVTGLDRVLGNKTWQYCSSYDLRGLNNHAKSFFELDDRGNTKDMRLGKREDLAYQAELTKNLFKCRPNYLSLSVAKGGTEQILEVIQDQLGLEVKIASFGPTAADKRTLAL